MASGGLSSLGRRLVAVAVAILLAVVVSACAAPNEDLSKALEQTRAGVHTVQLALDSLARGQTTSALAQVAASDAADEIASARHEPDRWLRSTRPGRWCWMPPTCSPTGGTSSRSSGTSRRRTPTSQMP